MAENSTNDSEKLTNLTTEQTESYLDIEIPERPQRIPGFISQMIGYGETIQAIDEYLVSEELPPLKQGDDLDLLTYYLVFGTMGGIPQSRPVTVYHRLEQKKIDKTFRMRR